MILEIEPSLSQRIRDAVLQIDSDPKNIRRLLHYRGCSTTQPLEVMPDASADTFPFFVPQEGVKGGIIKRCPECGAKGEI
ncbi:hypothetical protein HY338_03790 [Candidatus Gottesmanbacteria bacterium]|nr:hypothetical protein [Candidatus Gottesmanbacteria bacterium]